MQSFRPLSLGALASAPGAPASLKRATREVVEPSKSGDDANLLDLTRALCARLSARDRRGAEGGDLTATQRTLLADLARRGPTTLPQLARARSVSRQQVRVVVEALALRGLVRRASNPAHRRSYLVGVTPAGAVLAREVGRRESRTLSQIEDVAGADAVRGATLALRAVLRALDENVEA